jgi:hypothetical protein
MYFSFLKFSQKLPKIGIKIKLSGIFFNSK